MRSTESAPGSPEATASVAGVGMVNATTFAAVRELSARLVGDRIRSNSDSSRTASTGTSSSTDRAGIVVHDAAWPDADAGDRELDDAASGGNDRSPFRPSVTGAAGFAGTAKQQPRRVVQVREGIDVDAVLRMHLEVEVVDALGVAGVAVVGDQLAGLDA